MAGQQSENLLDMDDDPPTDSPATAQQSTFGSDSFNSTTTKPAANPLDDLLGLFDNAGLGGGMVSNGNIEQNSSFGGMMDFSAPSITTNNSMSGRKDADLLADLF